MDLNSSTTYTIEHFGCLTSIDHSKSWPKKVSILSLIYLGTNSLLSYVHMALGMIKHSQALTQGQNVALGDFSLLRCIQTCINLWNKHYAFMCLQKAQSPVISNLSLLFIYSSCLNPTLGMRQLKNVVWIKEVYH